MILSTFCIRRPVFTTLLTLALVVAGLAGYRALPVSALPRVDFPTISVSASLPGASPETMASSVATPLERQFSTIAGLDSMTSTSALGSTNIILQFNLDRDIDGAALDVQAAIATVQRRLPAEMTSAPSFQKVNPADQPILFIAVSSDTLPVADVDEIAETLLSQRISTLPGVAQVQVFGAQKYAVRVQANPQALAAHDLSFQDLSQALGAAASIKPTGVLNGGPQLFTLKVVGQPKDADGFRSRVIAWRSGAPVRLNDVATVSDSVEDLYTYGAIDGRKAVVLAVQRQPDANTVDVVDSVRKLLPNFRSQVPASVTLTPLFDRSVAIRNAVNEVQVTLGITIVLVVGVIFLFLRSAAATFIPAVVVPLSLIATCAGMAALGFSINNISLLGLTLCVGLVVDDAIVVLENITRHIEKGLSVWEAALKGSQEIGFTVLSMTLSLVAVFIPVIFMGGVVGRLFREFAITLSLAVLISGLLALTLTPMLCSRWLRPHRTEEHEGAVGRRLAAGFSALQRGYARALDATLHHQRMMLGVTLFTLVVAIAAYIYAPKGFIPLEDTGFAFVATEAAQDIGFDALKAKHKEVARIFAADPAVDHVFVAMGGGRSQTNAGRMFIGLKPHNQRPPVGVVLRRLREEASAVPGLSVFLQPVQNLQIGGRPAKSLYQYTLRGSDLAELYAWAAKIEGVLAHEPAFRDVTTDVYLKSLEARVSPNADESARLGVNDEVLRSTLYAAFGNAQVATLYTPSNSYQVILEVPRADQRDPQDIQNIYVRSATGALVPLASVAALSKGTGPLSIAHQGQLPSVTISFNLAPGVALGQAVDRLHALESSLALPTSIVTDFQGLAQAFQASVAGQGFLILLTVLVIYIILGMLYESFIHPLTILSGLPSAGLGAIIMLVLTGFDLDVIAIIGIVLLIGIVKKNAIMMVDVALNLRRQGLAAEEAIRQACALRFRPIMMTTAAALFGAIPVAVGLGEGAEVRQPLGVAVLGGLVVSQALTLFITPVVYLYLERLGHRFASAPTVSRRFF